MKKYVSIDKIQPSQSLEKYKIYKPAGVMLKCLMCDLLIASPHDTIKDFKCPNCNSDVLVPVEKFGVVSIKGGNTIITTPN